MEIINDWIIEVSILQTQSQYKPELSKDKKGKTKEGGTSKGTKSYREEVPFLAKAFAQPFPITVLHSDLRNLPQQHPRSPLVAAWLLTNDTTNLDFLVSSVFFFFCLKYSNTKINWKDKVYKNWHGISSSPVATECLYHNANHIIYNMENY